MNLPQKESQFSSNATTEQTRQLLATQRPSSSTKGQTPAPSTGWNGWILFLLLAALLIVGLFYLVRVEHIFSSPSVTIDAIVGYSGVQFSNVSNAKPLNIPSNGTVDDCLDACYSDANCIAASWIGASAASNGVNQCVSYNTSSLPALPASVFVPGPGPGGASTSATRFSYASPSEMFIKVPSTQLSTDAGKTNVSIEVLKAYNTAQLNSAATEEVSCMASCVALAENCAAYDFNPETRRCETFSLSSSPAPSFAPVQHTSDKNRFVQFKSSVVSTFGLRIFTLFANSAVNYDAFVVPLNCAGTNVDCGAKCISDSRCVAWTSYNTSGGISPKDAAYTFASYAPLPFPPTTLLSSESYAWVASGQPTTIQS